MRKSGYAHFSGFVAAAFCMYGEQNIEVDAAAVKMALRRVIFGIVAFYRCAVLDKQVKKLSSLEKLAEEIKLEEIIKKAKLIDEITELHQKKQREKFGLKENL